MTTDRQIQLYRSFGIQMKRMSAGSASKPISILQEVLVKHKMIPEYSLVETTGFDHARSFTYRAYIDAELCAYGKDGTKQGAKHTAAQNLMQLFLDFVHDDECIPTMEPSSTSSTGRESNGYSSPSRPPSSLSSSSLTTLPSNRLPLQQFDEGPRAKEVVPLANCVGMVQEWCQQRQLSLPVYVEEARCGQDHFPTFTTSCTLTYDHTADGVYKTVASASNKKAAKKLAAHKMWLLLSPIINRYTATPSITAPPLQVANTRLQALREKLTASSLNHELPTPVVQPSPVSVKIETEVPSSSVDIPAVVPTAAAERPAPSPPPANEVLQQMQQTLEESDGAELLRLKVGGKNKIEKNTQTLWKLCEEQSIELDIMHVDDYSDEGMLQCMVQLAFGAHRAFVVCFGTGSNAPEARETAARNALQYLRMMATGTRFVKEE